MEEIFVGHFLSPRIVTKKNSPPNLSVSGATKSLENDSDPNLQRCNPGHEDTTKQSSRKNLKGTRVSMEASKLVYNLFTGCIETYLYRGLKSI